MRAVLKNMLLIGAVFISSIAFAQSAATGNEKLYTFGSGEYAFVLRQNFVDEIGYDATLQMEGTNEVWILNKSQGARGTAVYKNDTGRVFLRVNFIGGATLYPTSDSMGVPVIRKSEYRFEASEPVASDNKDNLASIEDWSRAYAYVGNKKDKPQKKVNSKMHRHNIEFTNWPRSKSAFKADLISHLYDLLENQSAQNVEKITVKIGEQPAASQNDEGLTIWVNPALGFAGRPSSEKILLQMSKTGN